VEQCPASIVIIYANACGVRQRGVPAAFRLCAAEVLGARVKCPSRAWMTHSARRWSCWPRGRRGRGFAQPPQGWPAGGGGCARGAIAR
jgi:hypothetical protein